MKKKLLKMAVFIVVCLLIGAGVYLLVDKKMIGKKIDSYKGIDVYYNGINTRNHNGKSYNEDEYYYGNKWQCVEFVKRFYYEAKRHKMPDVYGNAKDFFDDKVEQGNLNKRRGLIQYRNGLDVKPKKDDIFVFTDKAFGHVAIVKKVGKDYVEIIQQNVFIITREKYKLINKKGNYFVDTKRTLAGWLRKE